MNVSPTTGIRVESSGFDVSYVLPARPSGALRWMGLLYVVIGLAFILKIAYFCASLLSRFEFRNLVAATESSDPLWGLILTVIIIIPIILMPLFYMFLGILAICGRSRVDWRDRQLSVLEYAGPIRWQRRMPLKRVRKFRVDCGVAINNGKPETFGSLLGKLGVLTAEFDLGKPRILVQGYPRVLLEQLAADLAWRIGASSIGKGAPEVEFSDARDSRFLTDVPQKPADSRVTIDYRFDGLLMTIPPAGVWKGSKGLFGFAICWCLFTTVITVQEYFSEGGPWLPAWFLLIGLAMLAAAINMGVRRATLAVDNTGLTVTYSGLFGTKIQQWRSDDIGAIGAGISGWKDNGTPVIELQIHPLHGKKIGLFAGYNEEELRFVATELRKALNVPARKN